MVPKQEGALSDINKWRLEKLRGATTAAKRFPRPARGRRNEKPRTRRDARLKLVVKMLRQRPANHFAHHHAATVRISLKSPVHLAGQSDVK